MQYRSAAVATSRSEESAHRQQAPEGRCLQPAGAFAQGQNGDVDLDQSLDPAFDQRRTVLQSAFADRDAGRCVAQNLALDQATGKGEMIQPVSRYRNA